MFPSLSARRPLPVWATRVHGSQVGEAAGVFFVLMRNVENRLLKFVVAEFLKRDSCCDRGENGDVCEGEEDKKGNDFYYLCFPPLHLSLKVIPRTHTQRQRQTQKQADTHTEFDREAWW